MQTLFVNISQVATIAIVAMGMTLVIATEGVDLSVGAVIAISAAMGTVLINPALGNELITNDILAANTTNTPLWIVVIVILGVLILQLSGLDQTWTWR